MKMGMENKLPGSFVNIHAQIHSVGIKSLKDGRGNLLLRSNDFPAKAFRDILQGWVVLFGDKNSVSGLNRCYIQKGQKVFRGENFLAGNASLNQAAENAIVHNL
jgi:hypothetical protein